MGDDGVIGTDEHDSVFQIVKDWIGVCKKEKET